MTINSITPNITPQKQPLINAKNTGYIAAASVGLTMISGMTKNKTLNKGHKIFASLSLISIISHMYLVLSKHSHKQNYKSEKSPLS